MGQLVLSGAGALLGGSIGGSLGLQVGWLAGSLVGSLLFPGSKQNTEGPRIQDASITSASYGTPITKLKGTSRIAGNIVFATDLSEQKIVTSQGKGGGSTTTTYDTFISFAVSFCEGPIGGVRRIWADGNIIYDATGTSSASIIEGLKFRFYKGTDDQAPDPLIESEKSSPAAAFPGICYILFEDFKLNDFGGRVPSISAELVEDGPSITSLITLTDYEDGPFPVSIANEDASGRISNEGSGYYSGYSLSTPANPTVGSVSTANINRAWFHRIGTATFSTETYWIGWYLEDIFGVGNVPADTSQIRVKWDFKVAQNNELTQGTPVRWASFSDLSQIATGDTISSNPQLFFSSESIDWHYLDSGASLVALRFQSGRTGYMGDVVLSVEGPTGSVSISDIPPPEPPLLTYAAEGSPTDIEQTHVVYEENLIYARSGNTVRSYDMDTGSLRNSYTLDSSTFVYGVDPAYGDLLTVNTTPNPDRVYLLDGDSGVAETTPSEQDTTIDEISVPITNKGRTWWITQRGTEWLATNNGDFTDTDTFAQTAGYTLTNIHPGENGLGYAYALEKSVDDIRVVRFDVIVSVSTDPTDLGTIQYGLVDTITKADLIAFGFTTGTLGNLGTAIHYDASQDSIFADIEMNGTIIAFRYSLQSNSILWATEVPFGNPDQATPTASAGFSLLNGSKIAWRNGSRAIVLDQNSGEIDQGIDGTVPYASVDVATGYWNAAKSSFVGLDGSGNISRFMMSGAAVVPTNLPTILYYLCIDAGLTAEQIDISLLNTDVVVYGFTQTRQTTVREYLKTLASAYSFDFVEVDGKITFVPRGRPVVATITEADLISVDNSGSFYQLETIEATTIPSELFVTFIDKDEDYAQGTENGKRPTSGAAISTQNSNSPTLEIPIAGSGNDFRQLAYTLLWEGWSERQTISFSLPRDFLYLNPTNAITMDFFDGRRGRIVQIEYGANNTLRIKARVETDDNYEFDDEVLTDTPEVTDPVISSLTRTSATFLDIPLLRDADADGASSSRLYTGARNTAQSYQGAILYQSRDDVDFSNIEVYGQSLSYGKTTTILGSTNSPFTKDITNTVTVRMSNGEDQIASVTETQMLNGSNAAAIKTSTGAWEIIGFQTVVDNGDGTYTLSNLLRGLRGTSLEVGNHASSSLFILLDVQTLLGLSIDQSDLDTALYYKAVTNGLLEEDTASESFTHTGRDLHPYPVVQQTATENAGDIDFAWQRQTRIGGAQKDGTDIVPLSEDTESYEIDIYNAAGDTVLRTLTATTNSKTYTSAQITTDLGSLPETIKVAMYQISADVGRGFGSIQELEVK